MTIEQPALRAGAKFLLLSLAATRTGLMVCWSLSLKRVKCRHRRGGRAYI
ncbi:MAG: hypothetical protein AW11_02941 [Candidatus Accumulibacter regalis]|jgi:hypothetical protein|uniref:Uncharacterized protein n=1 Tax=Accumulibacter regalis TaxID=522306 RepID=A0A011QCD8_ACCRE|nr:hypothetical protein [Accumulibacter sp.]EXI86770.1 MAG: hypothetical protein AW11_02941 [Candidatus Accumulibacter regalis]MBN8516171.1 hypothetical protein [Accumulibacter sp.]MBO3703017.1 hypothetical protein [Accumulibacter sp.]HRE72195.1 hypothetical protein [Accumulibacter sp.]HRE86341.1 hypothetical protein [Accumulibacter sp.]